MNDERPNIQLELENLPENVTLIREMLSGLGEALAIDPERLDDIKTAVSEAANNVVLHAYDGGRGPLDVSVLISADMLDVVVRDRGMGIRPRPYTEDRIQGIGLAVIQALTDRAEFRGAADEGTEVRMGFFGELRGGLPVEASAVATMEREPIRPRGTVVVSVAPTTLLGGVLGRLLGALAARARFSLDRLSDGQLVTDTLAAHVPAACIDEQISFGIASDERCVELSLGPLRPGTTERLISESAIAGLEPLLVKLTDSVVCEPVGDGEMLHLTMTDSR